MPRVRVVEARRRRVHRQGETEHFDACPICKEKSDKRKRVDVRDGVWFTCCPACHSGMRAFFLHKRPRGN